MCLIAFAWQAHPRWQLVLAGNRDEFHDRPSAPAGWWPDAPAVFGGRDLEAGGSWLALDRRGRLAAVTNFREPLRPRGPRSRGELVAGFVGSDQALAYCASEIVDQQAQWSGFNLLMFDLAPGGAGDAGRGPASRARYLSNRLAMPQTDGLAIEPGIHGLSNHLLDTDWPKVRTLRERLADALTGAALEADLFAALADDGVPADAVLPDTGVGQERERMLAPAMIRANGYGTRASTLILVGYDGQVEFVERSWAAQRREPVRESRASFSLLGNGDPGVNRSWRS
ncbi:MAG: NRDE family protein [Burkholderiaceae bacterium]